jgi:hypothetical protein
MNGMAPSGVGTAEASAAAPGSAAPRARWRSLGSAVALAAVVLFIGVADGFPLVALPLGVLLLGLSGRQRWWWMGLAVIVWGLALVPVGGALYTLSRGWALLLGGAFLAATLLRPRWSAFARGLAGVVTAVGLAAAWLAATGRWSDFDRAMSQHFEGLAILTSRELLARFPDASWAQEIAAMAGRLAQAQSTLFPSFLALQSLAALALVWWVFSRSRSRARSRPSLRPLRDFRFNDALIWVAIAGVLLVIAPLGDGAVRVGYNVLLFMGALYVLRGFAVFVFLARGAPSAISVVLGVIAAVFFYPLVFTAALLVGLGDTWLDVRGRVLAAATRA